jgi:hypothetical protein
MVLRASAQRVRSSVNVPQSPGGSTVDVRGRSDFSRFDPRARRRPHFSNFGPPAAPTLATLLAAWIEDLFAEAPVGAGWGPRRTLAHRGPSDRLLAGLVPICTRYTLVDLIPKYPTLASTTPGWPQCSYDLLRLHRVSASICPASTTPPAAPPVYRLLDRQAVQLHWRRRQLCTPRSNPPSVPPSSPYPRRAPPHRLSPSATSTPRRLHPPPRLRARPPPITCRAAACQMSRCSTLPGASVARWQEGTPLGTTTPSRPSTPPRRQRCASRVRWRGRRRREGLRSVCLCAVWEGTRDPGGEAFAQLVNPQPCGR